MPTRQRLLLCRCGFVLFAILPTLVVGGWVLRRGMPDYALAQRAEWERELSTRLGVAVEIGKLEYPQPGVARLSDVRLSNLETGDEVATFRQAEVGQKDGNWAIEVFQPIIQVDQLALLGGTLHERLLQNASQLGGGGELVAKTVTLQRKTDALSLGEVIGVVGQTPTGDPVVDLEFAWTAVSGEEARGQLTIVRNRQLRPPVTRFELNTQEAALPCWLAADSLPALRQLGRDAHFAGAAAWMTTAEGLHAQVIGRISEMDLDSLVSEQLLHQLSGRASVALQPATVERGQLTELRGTLQSHDGWISPSLLAAAEQHLGVQVPGTLPEEGNRLVPFRQMSIGFHLTERELLLTGGCDVSRPGVALANAAGPLAEVPPQHATASVNLLRTLLPESDWQVPATRQTGTLAALLPVPDLSPELTARRSSHTPARLGPATGSAETSPVRQPR